MLTFQNCLDGGPLHMGDHPQDLHTPFSLQDHKSKIIVLFGGPCAFPWSILWLIANCQLERKPNKTDRRLRATPTTSTVRTSRDVFSLPWRNILTRFHQINGAFARSDDHGRDVRVGREEGRGRGREKGEKNVP